MERLFLLFLAGRCCENLQSARSPTQCKSGPGNNMVSYRRDQLLHHVSPTIHLHLAGFTRQNAFEKNYPGEMLIEQIIEFELMGTWPPGRTCALRLVIFMTKQKSQRKIFEWIIIYS